MESEISRGTSSSPFSSFSLKVQAISVGMGQVAAFLRHKTRLPGARTGITENMSSPQPMAMARRW